jgi:hypothetical protein
MPPASSGTALIVTNCYGELITNRSKMMVNATIAIATMLACGTTVVDAQISSVEPQSHTTYASRILNCDRL